MRDYKLSEFKEICNANPECTLCPLRELCDELENTVGVNIAYLDLEIDENDKENEQ